MSHSDHREHEVDGVIAEARRKVELISSKPPKPINQSVLERANAVGFRVAVLRGVILMRVQELAAASISALEARQPAAAVTLVRATLESMVMLYDLKLALGRVVVDPDDSSVSELDNFVRIALWGRRYNKDKDAHDAANVIGRIKRLAKDIPAVWSIYENLSEVAHPNSDGLVGLYLTYREVSGDLVFSADEQWPFLLVAAHNLNTILDAVIIWDNELRSQAAVLDSLHTQSNAGAAADGGNGNMNEPNGTQAQ